MNSFEGTRSHLKSFSHLNYPKVTLRKRFCWIKTILAGSTTEFTSYQNVSLIQQNIWLIQSNFLIVLTKSEYLVDSIKKFISINQDLFDLTKFPWVSNKTVLLVLLKLRVWIYLTLLKVIWIFLKRVNLFGFYEVT